MSKQSLILSSHERTKKQLKRLQALPLSQKIALSKRRITQFHNYYSGKVYISFSGGKDSTVLLNLVRSLFPLTKAVFLNTGLEYPEIIDFVKSTLNVFEIKPKKNFKQILQDYGYPVVSKETAQKINEIRNTNSTKLRNKRLYGDENGNGKIAEKWKFLIDAPFKISHNCCNILKKNPAKAYERKTKTFPIIGDMASESRLRETVWLRQGCNSFNTKRPSSHPLAFWNTSDIWEYIKLKDLPYSKIYDLGEKRTGCTLCLFGCQFNDEDGIERFFRMKKNHPSHYKAAEKLGIIKVLAYVRGETDEDT